MFRTIAAFLTVAGVIVAIFGFHDMRPRPATEVALDESEGFSDLKLPIAQHNCDSRGGCVLDVKGTYQKEPIALQMVFAPDMRENRFEDLKANGGLSAKKNGIALQLQGKPGENFVRMLASVYRVPIASVSLPQTIPLTAVPLEGNPQDIAATAIRFKVFHGDADPDTLGYFELYIDPDLLHGLVSLNEKDTEYRKPILRSLGATLQ